MKLGFEESQAVYTSGSQQARDWTESWVAKWLYCVNCGNPQMTRFQANLPVADFFGPGNHIPAIMDQGRHRYFIAHFAA